MADTDYLIDGRRLPPNRFGLVKAYMPRYFYHVYGDTGPPDDVGVDLVDLMAAQREAINFTSEVLRDERMKFVHDKRWQLDVTDDAGLIVFQVEVSLTEAPALRHDPPVRP